MCLHPGDWLLFLLPLDRDKPDKYKGSDISATVMLSLLDQGLLKKPGFSLSM